MAGWRTIAAGLLSLALCGCVGLGPAQRARAEALVQAGRSDTSTCAAADACAQPSPLHALAGAAFAESASGTPRHRALILDDGRDALLARINLIRSATTGVDLQTYIFEEDDAGRLVLDELLAAAKRGVRVRVLIDQLSALERVQTLAALAGAHRKFEIRIYNPVLQRARISYPMYLLASACCWHKLNHRMHSKLLLVDDAIGITGGRNYQDDYYDWDADYNFRDRDLLVAGPVARDMAANFDAFWDSRRSVPVEQLADVGGMLLKHGIPALPDVPYEMPERVVQMSNDAGDEQLAARLAGHAMDVGAVRFIADVPSKSRRRGARLRG